VKLVVGVVVAMVLGFLLADLLYGFVLQYLIRR